MIKLLHLLPSVANLYGDRANLLVLRRALEAMGAEAEIITCEPGEKPAPADLIYLGPATEEKLGFAIRFLLPYRAELASALVDGVPLMFFGSAAEAAGEYIEEAREKRPALALAGYNTLRCTERITGDVIYTSVLSEKPLVGFINCSGRLRGVNEPLFTSRLGAGCILGENGEDTGREGTRSGSLLASYCIGPVLVKNPWLKELTARELLRRCAPQLADNPLPPDASDRAYEVTLRELSKRIK